jgi:hypothetical protein
MITYEETIALTDISGSAVGYSAGATDTPDDGQDFESGGTFDWGNGALVTTVTRNVTDFGFLLEDAADVQIDDTETRYTFAFPKDETVSNGEATSSIYTIGRTENTDIIVGDPAISVIVDPPNTDWSRSSVNLASYELQTLENQTGLITTTTETQEQVRTTEESGEDIVTTFTAQNITRTTTSQINTSTVATWSRVTYDTFFVTGQTTIKKFSSFANALPAVVANSEIITTEQTIEPRSFVEIDTYAGTQNFTLKSASATFSLLATTRTTQGAVITNSTNPQTIVGGSKVATTGNGSFTIQNTQQQNAQSQYTTVSINTRLSSTKQLDLIGQNVVASYESTSSIGRTSAGYETLISQDDSFTQTQSGFYEFSAVNQFTTARPARLIGVKEITVGVRAESGGAAGGGVDAAGAGNSFYRHTTSVFLPASAVRAQATRSTTWSLNSYTVRDSNEGETVSQFGVTGSPQSQWMTVAATQSSVAAATVLGGPIAGRAIIFGGAYSTFADTDESSTEITEPFSVAWSASAATTAWLPAFRVETVQTSTNVLAVSRHSFTQVLDD